MEFRIITGRAGAGKTQRCLDEICAALAHAPEGRALFFLLPEHATFQAEKRLAAQAGDGFSRAHVYGFRRLALRILQETGGALRPRVDAVGKRLLLSKALADRKDALRALSRAARQRNFTDTVAQLIEECKSYAVDPARLREAAAALEDEPLRDKLLDLACIYDSFSQEIGGRYTDNEDLLALAAEQAAASKLLAGAQVWIDGFTFFNPLELRLLARLCRAAGSIAVTLSIAAPESAEHEQETAPFHRQWKTYQALRALASACGQPAALIELTGASRFENAALAHLERQFFCFPQQPLAQSEGVTVAEAANRRAEAEGVAADMIRLCRDEGCRWRDIGVLARDMDAYGELLETVFAEYGIPFFRDAKRPCLHHPLAELLRSAPEAVQGWNYEPLFRCFKTDFFPATREEIDRLENYVLTCGIRGKRWTADEDWRYSRLPGEDGAAGGAADEALAAINAIRRRVAAPLAALAARLKAAKNAEELTAALYALLVDLDAPQTLERWAAEAEARGALDEAKEHAQLWTRAMDFFDQIVETCGEERMDSARYAALLSDGVERMEFSLIPPGLDAATIAPLDQNSLDNARAIYVVGANESVLPRRARGEGLLSDLDRLRLRELGVELPAGTAADNFAEPFAVYAALTRARRWLWISYPLADEEGGGLKPSPLIKKLRRLLGLRAVKPLPLSGAEMDEAQLTAAPGRALSQLAGALRDCKRGGALRPFWRDVYNWALQRAGWREKLRLICAGLFQSAAAPPLPRPLAARLYLGGGGSLRGSVTRFERFSACPFQHFAQYGLRLKERAVYSFAAPDLGQFLHAALRLFGERLASEGRAWGSVGDEECGALCAQIAGALAPQLQNEILLSTPRYRHFLSRIRRTLELAARRLAAFDRASAFRPVALEKSFGRGKDALPALSYALPDGARLEIAGQIDRIDLLEAEARYFLVIDYKSGSAYLQLLDVYYGLRLQLLTYLLAARRSAALLTGGDAQPAGALYYYLKRPLLTEKRRLSEREALDKLDALLKMPGWLLADVGLLRQIDASGRFTKVALTSKNAIHGASKHAVKTPEEFETLLSHAENLLRAIGEEILRGNVGAAPYELDGRRPCAFCPYSALCRFDPLLPGCAARILPKHSDAEIMERIQREEGITWLGPTLN